ncbi:unnamed protein product [Lactuca saligna]|uniref:Uncharacterized protein n=1 Tax=Lactuca saligna TaxID=75948 RepID=A0AA35YUK2_LACSI|nr:unnamed protein product [Lactuca saligna]
MPSSPFISIVPISSIAPLPPSSFVGMSVPYISIPLSTPIFTYSTYPTSSLVSNPLKVPWVNLLNTHQATIEQLTSANSKVIEESTKAAQPSDKKIIEAVEKREALSKIQADIKMENVYLQSTITNKLDTLKVDLAAENKIMEALVEQTRKAKVLNEKVKHENSEIARLQDEKFSINACNSEIHQRLLRIIENKSHPFNDTVRLPLSEKHKPVFALLNQIVSVSASSASLKQVGQEEVKVKEEID